MSAAPNGKTAFIIAERSHALTAELLDLPASSFTARELGFLLTAGTPPARQLHSSEWEQGLYDGLLLIRERVKGAA